MSYGIVGVPYDVFMVTVHPQCCVKGRLVILKLSNKDPTSIVESSNEFYGAYRNTPRFHRYHITASPSVLMTNESSERV